MDMTRIAEVCTSLVPATPEGLEPVMRERWGAREIEPGLYEVWVESLLLREGGRDVIAALADGLRKIRETGVSVSIDHEIFKRRFVFTLDAREGVVEAVKFGRPIEKVFGEAQRALVAAGG